MHHLEVVDQPVVPNFKIYAEVLMRIDLLPSQNELKRLINCSVLALGSCCVFYFLIHCYLHSSAQYIFG